MGSLFDADTATEPPAAPGRPAGKVVRALEGYGYRADVVRTWTPEKANTVLASCRREELVTLRRADTAAKRQGEEYARGRASGVERREAADAIEQAYPAGPDELCQTLMYTLYVLSDGELRKLAESLVPVYRGEVEIR